MPIDPKININENQVIFKRDVGHKHDGLTSSLIDYTKYSLFDFLPSVRASGGARLNYQVANERSLKTFIVDAVEERVLNPQGIRIQANTITANEIAVGTITANELVRDFIMVNNTMKSNNYVAGSAGWKISNTGDAEFNDVTVRGNVQANVGAIGGWLIDSNGLTKTISGSTSAISPAQIDLGILNDEVSGNTSIQAARMTMIDANYLSRVKTDGISITEFASGTTSYFKHFGAVLNGSIQVSNGNNIKAITSFKTSSSSTTARVTQGDEAGFDNLCRPSSLRNLKENIEDIQDALSILSDLRPRTYNFKVDAFSPIDPNTQQPWTEEARALAQLDLKYGFIVEEIFDSRPELVSYSHEYTTDDPYGEGGYFDFSSWKPTMWEDIDVLVLCVKAIQELSTKVTSIESRLQALEGV
jgi:hypothetical protein